MYKAVSGRNYGMRYPQGALPGASGHSIDTRRTLELRALTSAQNQLTTGDRVTSSDSTEGHYVPNKVL